MALTQTLLRLTKFMDNLKVLHSWKNRKKLSIFNIYYLKKSGEIGFVGASWQKCYNEEEVLMKMKKVEESHEFEKWLTPNSEEIQIYLTHNII